MNDMKKLKDYILMTCLVLGILLMTLVPFVYNLLNPGLTRLEVFLELWWLSAIGSGLCLIALYFCRESKEKKTRVPKMRNPPPPPENKISVKDVYEFLETRAQNYETIQDCHRNEAFPLYVNINEVYHVLSLYHHGQFGGFLRIPGLCYDHGFGCAADDFDLPEFPAEKSKKLDA